MLASIINQTATSVTIQVTIPIVPSMLSSEDTIQSVLNEAGQLATVAALKHFDREGRPMSVVGNDGPAKGKAPSNIKAPMLQLRWSVTPINPLKAEKSPVPWKWTAASSAPPLPGLPNN